MTASDILRCVSVAAIFLAGSCAAPETGYFADPMANHPLSVQPHYVEADFTAPAPQGGLNPVDSTRFGHFVADYLDHGRGTITVSVPDGPAASGLIALFGEKLASLGVPRERILVGTYAAEADAPVKLGYLDYAIKSDPCGDWSENAADNLTNRPMANFGCATQHNIAAQLANPKDLVSPEAGTAPDAVRRTTVLDKYEKGTSTATDKPSGQSAKISDVGSSGN